MDRISIKGSPISFQFAVICDIKSLMIADLGAICILFSISMFIFISPYKLPQRREPLGIFLMQSRRRHPLLARVLAPLRLAVFRLAQCLLPRLL